MSPKSLTPLDLAALAALNQEVNDGALMMEEGYIQAGTALAKIRASRAYKKYASSWALYCASVYPECGKHWTMDGSTANRAIAALKTAEQVSADNGVMPKAESVARALRQTSADPVRQKQVWELAVRSHPAKAPTAEWVAAAGRTIQEEQTTGGYVTSFNGGTMVRATSLTMIEATVADAEEQVKDAAQRTVERQIKQAGGMKYENYVSKVPIVLVGVNALEGTITFKMASNHAAYIRDGINAHRDDSNFITVGHYTDEELRDEQS